MNKNTIAELNKLDPVEALAKIIPMMMDLYEENARINKTLAGMIAEKKGRVNTSSKTRMTHSHLSVHQFGCLISKSTYTQWERQEYLAFEFARFFKTNKKGVFAMQFLTKPAKNSVIIESTDSSRDSTWQINNTAMVNAVFGGVKFGDSAKFYNAVRTDVKGHPNTVLLFTNETALKVVETGIEITSGINLTATRNVKPRISVTKGRTRFNLAFLEEVGIDTECGKNICVRPEYESDGAKLFFYTAKEPHEGDLTLTFEQNQGLGSYAICLLDFQRKLGVDPSDPKSYKLEWDYLGNKCVKVQVVKK